MTRFRRTLRPLFAGLLTTLLLGSGCQTSEESCISQALEAQPRARFVVGETFYLPTVQTTGSCAGSNWVLTGAPTGNANLVIAGADGITRFTPALPGRYEFALQDGTVYTFDAVAAGEQPFHNLGYYPSQSLALVQGELWAANVFSPTIARLDPATLASLGEITVGAWPVAIAWQPGMPYAVVAHRGSDTLGLVDIAAGRIIDAIWVGDEPANVILSPDGSTAYAALSTESAVVAVDIGTRAVTARYDTGLDPRAMALSEDGILYVASYRSAQTSRFPYGDDPVEEQKDITVIDTTTGNVSTFLDKGDTIHGLMLADGKLYMSTSIADTQANFTDLNEVKFAHSIVVLDATTGEQLQAADLSHQESAGGLAVTAHSMALAGGKLWVAIEGSDLTLGLNPETLAEEARVQTEGRPRALVADGDAVLVHGAQGYLVTRIANDAAAETGSTGADPRSELLAEGQRIFSGAGDTFGANWSCNSCHADAVSDRRVWRVGPVEEYEVTRPLFWLEGTENLGWTGYLSSVRMSAFAGQGTVGIRPTTEQFLGAEAYLASLMPPPAANGLTARDGTLSEQGQRGKELFEGKGQCQSCHPMPLTTNKQLLANGITPGETDVPSLVGAYRHGTWLKTGDARTMRDALKAVAAAPFVADFTKAELDDLTRYMLELTARDFFLLSDGLPLTDSPVPVDAPIKLTFSEPVWQGAENLANITLLDANGGAVPMQLVADGRAVTLTPDAELSPESNYTIRIAAGFESWREKRTALDQDIAFETGALPQIELQGSYVWTVQLPVFDPSQGGFDPNNTLPVEVPFTATSRTSGADTVFDYGQGLSMDLQAVISGEQFHLPPLGIPVGNNMANAAGLSAALVDSDSDGVADSASGTLVMSAPGLHIEGVAWTVTRASGECIEGASGDLPVDVTIGMDGIPVIDWGMDEALGVYVTSPGANLPAGPGTTVSNGTAYWALELASFPNGFGGPVSYGTLPEGATDVSEVNGAPLGGAALQNGACYEFQVITMNFESGSYTINWQQ